MESVLDHLPDGFLTLDPRWHITDANPQVLRWAERTREQLLGRPLSEILPHLATPHQLGRALAERTSLEFEYTWPGKNLFLRVRAHPTPDGGLAVLLQDVSAARKAPSDEPGYRALVESSPQFVWILNPEGHAEFANQSWVAYSGMGVDRRDEWGAALHPDDRQRTIDAWRAGSAAGQAYDVEYRLRRAADGEYRWHLARVTPERDGAGRVVRWVAVATDIHEQKLAEDALRRSEVRLRLAVEAARLGTWERDIATGHMACSPVCKAIFGRPPGGRFDFADFERAVHPDDRDRVRAAIDRSIQDRTPYKAEYRCVWPDGAVHWVLASGHAEYDDAGQPVRTTGVTIDVTARKQEEEERQRLLDRERAARAEADAANAAKDRFLAVLSHELRTPLTPVLIAVSAMEADPNIPDYVREDLLTVRRNIDLETKLIDDLLDLSRVANGKFRLNTEPVAVHQLLRHVLEVCAVDMLAKRLQLVFDLRAGEDHVIADPARLQQVFWNLLKNAIKFTPEHGRVAIRTRNAAPGRLEIEVKDSGAGIAPDVLPRIFDAFEQGDPTVTRQFGGLGLGLAISKAIVDAHGGVIRAQSGGERRGATFTVELETVAAPTSPRPALADPGAALKPASSRILLVEDHRDTANVLAKLLARHGYRVRIAHSVASALEIAAAEQFDVVVSDIGLPDATGYELMEQLRDRYGAKGIALSGFGMEEDMQKSRAAGFVDHVVKPVDAAQLEAVLRRVTTRA